MKTFKHSGDLGDIIFSLPTVRALGGGILYLDPKGGIDEPLVQGCDLGDKTKLNENSIKSITPLLVLQPYIKEVRLWNGEKVTHNLDEFRKHVKYNNLADSHLAAFDLPFTERDEAWLNVELPKLGYYCVISRSSRYQSVHHWWGQVTKDKGLINNSVFLGHKIEHEVFEFTFNTKVRYVETPTLLDAAKFVSAANLVLCNQNVIHAIAEGMKKNIVQETYHVYPATIFKRPGAQYV